MRSGPVASAVSPWHRSAGQRAVSGGGGGSRSAGGPRRTIEVVHLERELGLLRLLGARRERREARHKLLKVDALVTVGVKQLEHPIHEQVALQPERLLELGLVYQPCAADASRRPKLSGSRGAAGPGCRCAVAQTGQADAPSSSSLALIVLKSSYSFSTCQWRGPCARL